ncbi:Polyadenylate-binding protein 2 [Glycine soja]|nr:Polyadenylate-binding protein 2 [Glycine soja]
MEEEEHEVYGGEIPDEGEMEGDIDMSAADDDAAVKELDEMKRRLKEMEEEAAALREMQAKVDKEIGSVQDPANSAASQANKEEADSRSVFVGNGHSYYSGSIISAGNLGCLHSGVECVKDASTALPEETACGSFGRTFCKCWACNPSHRALLLTAVRMSQFGSVYGVRIGGLLLLFGELGKCIFLVDYACTPEEVQQHFQSCGTVNRVTILTDKFGQPKGFAYVEFVEAEAVQEALLLNESELHGRQLKVLPKRTNVPGMKQYRPRRFNPYMAYGFRRPYTPPYFYSPYGYGKVPRFRRPNRYMPYH